MHEEPPPTKVELPPTIQEWNRRQKAAAFEAMVAGPTKRRPRFSLMGIITGRFSCSKENKNG